MKKISLKIKLTLLYTVFILVVVGTVLAILFSLSGREILASTKMSLERRVEESLDEIEMQDGELKINSDFYSVENGVYLSMYDSTGYFLYGKIPGGFDEQPDFLDGEVREIKDKAGEEGWYIYDLFFRPGAGKEIYVRGVISVTESEESFQTILRIAFILLPLLAAATAFVGYRFTKRTLRPVKDITDTVRKIRADADLSRRIENIENIEERRGKAEEKEETGEKEKTEGKEETGKAKVRRRRESGDEIYVLAQTFNGMLDELETVFEREKQFTSDVSHELRTPISVMMAQCDRILKDETLNPEQKVQIQLIRQKAKNMSDLIAQLLFLSRADQGRQQIEKENINLSELTEMIVGEQQFLADSKGDAGQIICHIEPEIWAEVDETLYIRMMINLLSNALRYGKGQDIEVSLSVRNDSEVIGKVKDHGTGIAKEDIPHIWERFYRADKSRTGGSHSGLGLSMVKWIAEAHGGSVEVISEEGVGSEFVFHLAK